MGFDCFQFGAIVNEAAGNIPVRGFGGWTMLLIRVTTCS